MTSSRWFVFGRVLCAAVVGFASVRSNAQDRAAPRAAEKPAERKRSALDEELFKNLDADPDAPDASAAPQPGSKARRVPADHDDDDPLRGELLKGLNAGEDLGEPGEHNPLARLNRSMREVEGQMARGRSGTETRQRQADIVRELEDLIRQAQRQKSSSSSSSGGAQKKDSQKTASGRDVSQPKEQPGGGTGAGAQEARGPARDSTAGTREQPARKPDMADMREVLKGVWGQLPEKQREQMLQSYNERFLPKYEQMIADYFRTIAEERQRRP